MVTMVVQLKMVLGHHTQAEYCAIPENRVFTLFLATGHQLARYNAFLFAKWKKQNIPIFFVRKNPPIQRYFYFSIFLILGSRRNFLWKSACGASLPILLSQTKILISHAKKWKMKKMAKNNLKNLLRTQKKTEKKIDEKMIFFVFFEVPTAKNNFPTRIFFFLIFIFFFFFGPQFHTAQ